MITQDQIDKAKADQGQYWESLWKDFTFFKKTPVDLSIFKLPNWDQYGFYHLKYIQCALKDFTWLAKYWAASYLDYHIFYMWNVDFENARLEGLDIKKASAQADKLKVERIKKFKELYP